jgi:hypothetical protein
MPNLEFLILFQRADAFIDQRLQGPGFRPRMLSCFLIENVPKQPSFFLRQVRQFFVEGVDGRKGTKGHALHTTFHDMAQCRPLPIDVLGLADLENEYLG